MQLSTNTVTLQILDNFHHRTSVNDIFVLGVLINILHLIHWWCFVGEMDDDESMQETNSPSHGRIGNTLPARYAL